MGAVKKVIPCEKAAFDSDAKLGNWRPTLDCGKLCPAFSTYNPQTSACPNTCADPKAEEHCEKGGFPKTKFFNSRT